MNARQFDEVMLDAEMYIEELLSEFTLEWLGNRAEMPEEMPMDEDMLDMMDAVMEVEDAEQIQAGSETWG